MTRVQVAVAIVLVWLVGLGWLAWRQQRKDEWTVLAEAAVRVDPAAFYYLVYQGETQIGVASSVIDTSRGRMRATDFFRGRLVISGDTQMVTGSSTAYLSRRLALDSFAIMVEGDRTPLRIRGKPQDQLTPLFLPTTIPVAFMLTGETTVGRHGNYWVYNPIARDVQRTTVQIRAESLLTVSDSAKFDRVTARWVSAHQDTVRAWLVSRSASPNEPEITAWVDAQGRVVSASERGGLHVMRTAYEQAFSNWRIEHH